MQIYIADWLAERASHTLVHVLDLAGKPKAVFIMSALTQADDFELFTDNLCREKI
jgi:hypothetical protein